LKENARKYHIMVQLTDIAFVASFTNDPSFLL